MSNLCCEYDSNETATAVLRIHPDNSVGDIFAVCLTRCLSSSLTAGVQMELPVCLPGVPSTAAALRTAFPAGESSLPVDREAG